MTVAVGSSGRGPVNPPKAVHDVAHIVGLGAQTSVGRTAASAAAAVRGQIRATGFHPFMVDRLGQRMRVSRAPWIPAEVSLERRMVALGVDAAGEALASVASALVSLRIGLAIVVGLPAARPGLPLGLDQTMCAALSRVVPPGIPVVSTTALMQGHVAGLAAIEEGCRLINEGGVGACLAGGVESYIERTTLEWIDWTGQLFGPKNPRGFLPGEAAGFCLLVSGEIAERAGLRARGAVLGAATAIEKKLRRDRAVNVGDALTESFRRTLAALPGPEVKVDQQIYDFNGQPHRAEEYAFAVSRIGPVIRDPGRFLTPAESWGDVGAASGPLFVLLAIFGARQRYGWGPYTLVWTSAMVAQRTSALVYASNAPTDGNGDSR